MTQEQETNRWSGQPANSPLIPSPRAWVIISLTRALGRYPNPFGQEGRSGLTRLAVFTCLVFWWWPSLTWAEPSSIFPTMEEMRERLGTAQKPPFEPADQILTRPSQTQWTRYLRSLMRLPEWIDLGVAFRLRGEVLTNPFRVGEFGTDDQLPVRTRLRVGLNFAPIRVFLEFQDSRSFGQDPGEFVSTTLVNEHEIQQLHISASFQNTLHTGLRSDVHVGRLNLDFGRRRLIARNVFRNTTNAFDGGHLNIGDDALWRFRAFVVRPTTRSFGVLDEPFTESDTMFWGTYYETQHLPWLMTNLYYYGLNDVDPGVSNQRQYSTFGGRFYHPPKKGEMDYEVESVWQVGTRAGKDHFAYFQHVELGYTWETLWTPRLLAQYDYASGTANPNGDFDQTFDTLFGARRWEYTPTGIFGPFFRSNINTPGIRTYLKPWPAGTLMVKYRAWWLAQGRDAWVGSGLQDPTGRAGTFLGQDLELRATWTPSPFITVDAGYDHFFKGGYIQTLAEVPGNPPADDSDYFYLQAEIKF